MNCVVTVYTFILFVLYRDILKSGNCNHSKFRSYFSELQTLFFFSYQALNFCKNIYVRSGKFNKYDDWYAFAIIYQGETAEASRNEAQHYLEENIEKLLFHYMRKVKYAIFNWWNVNEDEVQSFPIYLVRVVVIALFSHR